MKEVTILLRHLLTRQGEPHGVAIGGGLGIDATTDVVEVGIVLADDLTANDVLGALQAAIGMVGAREGGIEQGAQGLGAEGLRAVCQGEAHKVAILRGGEGESIGG